MGEWHSVSHDPSGIRVEFIPSKNRFWPPGVLMKKPLSADNAAGQCVVLTGQGAVWMYAHASATFRAAGAERVRVETPSTPGTAEDLVGSECRLMHAQGNKGWGTLFLVNLRSSPRLSPGAVDRLLQDPLKELARVRPQNVVLSGRASVDVYARIAAAAIDAGARHIACWSARDGLVVIFDRDGNSLGGGITRPEWLAKALPRPEGPMIIGITGDPNLGKSVFSGALDGYREQMAIDGWRLDCDGQAPTPPWYLSMVNQEKAKQVRELQKRDWTSEMEAAIAEQLKLSRELFPVLIADLPGGNHKAKPPQRVPSGRERLFSEIDSLILLTGKDAHSESGWYEALRPHGLEHRIAAVLRSDDPKGMPSLRGQSDGNIWRGNVTGLDRLRSAQDLAIAFQPGLDQLWTSVFKYAQQSPIYQQHSTKGVTEASEKSSLV